MYLLPINGVIGEDFKVTDLLLHLNAAKDEQEIKLIINSPGGYTDTSEQIRDALEKSGKIIHSANSGDIASAAVELFLIPKSKALRHYDPSKGVFLIHMPFIDPANGGVAGTADEIQRAVDEMKKLEKNIAKFYSHQTGTGANILEGFMKENNPLTPEQVDSLGFAIIEQRQELKAVAYYKPNKLEMENKEVNEKLGGIEKLLSGIMSFLRPKNIMVQDTTGAQIDFGDSVQDPSQIAVGLTATVEGNPAEGEFVMPDGTTLVFAAGTLSEIKPSEDETVESLKKERDDLKAELEAKSTEFDTFKQSAETQIKEISTQFKSFKNQFSKGNEGNDGTPSGDGDGIPSTRKAFK